MEFYLQNAVFIGDNEGLEVTLTIPAGTKIFGEPSSTNPGVLIITRGAKIKAEGTKSEPIVMTSARKEGSRAPGDWGGVVINGYAPIQGNEAEGEGNSGKYGGDDADDDSGVMKYVRIEFAGTLFSSDNELNGLALQGVGSGTTIDYIQIHQNADDGIEFFGGSVSATHLVLTGNGDDSIDFDDGWTGGVQYALVQQYPGNDNGIEGDGDPKDNIAPSSPVLANLTIVGAGYGDSDSGVRFRRSSTPTLVNSVVDNVGDEYLDTETSADDGGNAGDVTVEGCFFDGDGDSEDKSDNALDAGTGNNYTPGADSGLPATAINNYAATADQGQVQFDFTGVAAPADVTAQTVPATTSGVSFDDTDFVGAIDYTASPVDYWYEGWTSFPKN